MLIGHHKTIGLRSLPISFKSMEETFHGVVRSKIYIVTLSSTEAEFITLTHVTKQALWLHHFITEVFQLLKCPIKLYSDNQSAITIVYSNQQHSRTKHFDIWLYFLWDTIENGQISIQYLPTNQMLADILTKGLLGPKVKSLVEKLGICILGLRGHVECIYASKPSNQV